MSAPQSAKQYVTTYYRRFIGLGWARVLLVLAVLFTLFSMASPVWSLTDGSGANYNTATFDWTTTTEIEYRNGAWRQTTISSYSVLGGGASSFVNGIGGSYILQLVFLFVLIGAVVLYSLKWSQHLPGIGLLIVGLIVVVVAFVALLYPVLVLPPAAALGLGEPSISGYWGSAAPLSWGAALGWWFLLIAVILGIVGGVWPFLKSMRQPMVRPPPPREWQVER